MEAQKAFSDLDTELGHNLSALFYSLKRVIQPTPDPGGVEIDAALDSTLLERGVMKSHDKGHGYQTGKELGQMMQSTIMN